jgi:nicotinamide-nucleotide amidase
MKIGMLIIGNELLQGKQSEANLQALGLFLRTYFQQVHRAQFAADSIEEIHQALAFLETHCQLIVVTGGLGPTPDDKTKEALASYFHKAIHFNPEALAVAQANYQQFERQLPAGHTYSSLPEGFKALPNPAGFAPGLWYDGGRTKLVALPGVPREFQAMLTHLPQLLQLEASQRFNLVTVKTKGVAEEKIFNELCPTLWQELETFGEVSSLPHMLSVDIGVKTLLAPEIIYQHIQQSPLAPYVWSYGQTTLEEAILQKAISSKLTVGFAESCTGGLCAHRMTGVPGASQSFWGSVVCYDNSVKQNILGVSPTTLAQFGAVSEACALEMARGARNALNVDVAIALTGIAGPGGGSPEKPVGTVWVGVSGEKKQQAYRYQFKGDRENLKQRFSQIGLFTLLDYLS